MRETGGHGQPGGRGGRRGGRGGQNGGYRANLTVAEEETCLVFTEEDHELLEMLKMKQRVASDGGKKSMIEEASTSSSSRGNIATYAHSAKGTSSEFSSYTHLAVTESIQTADGTTQPVVVKVIFQEKGTGRRLGTDTWRSELWYLDIEGMDSALTSMVEKIGVGVWGMSYGCIISVWDILRLVF